MDVLMITDRAFSVYITDEELTARSLHAGDVSLSDAERLVSRVFGAELGKAKLELFSGRHGVMIFVRRPAPLPELYVFDGFEEVIDAARSSPDEPSALYFYDGSYILAVWRLDGAPGVLPEFAEKLDASQELLAHLAEHGRTLIEANAIGFIKEKFTI